MKRFLWILVALILLPVLSMARSTGATADKKQLSGQPAVKDRALGEGSGVAASARAACTIPTTCQAIEKAMYLEYFRIASCTTDADCGQVLNQTSCGCTKEWVARTKADSSCFYALKTAQYENICGSFAGASTCDCHPANGFSCHNGRCSWNYTM